MEMRVPCQKRRVSTLLFVKMKTRWTDIAVVLTADDVSGARAPADANDGDRRTVEADKHVDALDDDAEQAKDRSCSGVRCLLYVPSIIKGSTDIQECLP